MAIECVTHIVEHDIWPCGYHPDESTRRIEQLENQVSELSRLNNEQAQDCSKLGASCANNDYKTKDLNPECKPTQNKSFISRLKLCKKILFND